MYSCIRTKSKRIHNKHTYSREKAYILTHRYIDTYIYIYTHKHTMQHTYETNPWQLTVATLINVERKTTISHKAVAGPSAAKAIFPQYLPTNAVSASDSIGLAIYMPSVGIINCIRSRYVGTLDKRACVLVSPPLAGDQVVSAGKEVAPAEPIMALFPLAGSVPAFF